MTTETSTTQPSFSDKPQTLSLAVASVEVLPAEVYRVRLALPAEFYGFLFHAGQYLELVLDAGTADELKVPYSIASAPGLNELELHVMNQGAGTLSERVIQSFQTQDTVTAVLAMGECTLRTASLDENDSVLLIAAGTCFGQMKAMLEHAVAAGIKNPVYLYWGVRDAAQLYLLEEAKQWAAEHASVSFVPVVSEPDASWTGRTGFVHEAVLADITNLDRFHVYVCGSPQMVYAVEDAFVEQGLREGCIHSDVFAYAPRPEKA